MLRWICSAHLSLCLPHVCYCSDSGAKGGLRCSVARFRPGFRFTTTFESGQLQSQPPHRIAFLEAPTTPIRIQLQQGFAIDEMGFRDQVAQQQSRAAHVRFGSKADIGEGAIDVRFTPKADIDGLRGPLAERFRQKLCRIPSIVRLMPFSSLVGLLMFTVRFERYFGSPC